jgi:hypothetical protein
MIPDSNHGFKMTGLGKLVAKLLSGQNWVAELEPFAFSRFAEGRTSEASNGHCPWVRRFNRRHTVLGAGCKSAAASSKAHRLTPLRC